MSKLFDETVCLGVTFHRPGCHRQERRTRTGEVEVRMTAANGNESKPDQSQLKVTKRIFKHRAYKTAADIDHKLDQWIKQRSLPSPLKRGTHLIPIRVLDEVYERLRRDKAEYEARADELILAYDGAKNEARGRLKELYREEDYPSPERLRAAFWVEQKLFDFSPAGEGKLSEAVYMEERGKWAGIMNEAENEVKQALRQACLDLVTHLSGILSPKADGKRRRIFQSTVDKMTDFFDLFDKRNVLNDDELKKLVEKARGFVRGDEVFVDALKNSDDIREMVRKRMEEVKEKLIPLVEEGPRRVISFEED